MGKAASMKIKNLFLCSLVIVAIVCSCNQRPSRYLDLSTGNYVDLRKDTTSGYMVNSKKGEPVDFYVDTKTHDTVWGQTGEIVNGKIHKTEDGKWIVKTDGDEYKTKSESENSAKAQLEGDEYKVKNGNYTIKKEGDEDVKIENGKTQVKIDGNTGERKVKKDKNLTDKVKKIFH
jgi:hypothetical protein